jgi:uncharacterized membrane protein YeaQ/YmgE (transglycosylase-associated protein family)
MQSLPTPAEPLTNIAMGFITGLLPSSRGEGCQKYDALLDIVIGIPGHVLTFWL